MFTNLERLRFREQVISVNGKVDFPEKFSTHLFNSLLTPYLNSLGYLCANNTIMQIYTAGHRYGLQNFEDKTNDQTLQFIHKEPNPDNSTELLTINDGTSTEEVLEVLIDRMKFLNEKFPCRENSLVITKLEESLMWLNKRTADRLARNVEGKHVK